MKPKKLENNQKKSQKYASNYKVHSNFLEKNQLHFGEALTIQGITKEKLERGVQAAFNDCNMKMNQTGKKLQN